MSTMKTSQAQYLSDGNQDGTKFAKNPRSNPKQTPVQALGFGQVVTYQETLSAVSVATITTAEQALTVGTTAGNGPATTDFLAAVNKPTTQAGIGVHTGRISAANTITLTYSNTTGGWLTPTATQVYNVTVLRNATVNTQTLTPAIVPANNTSETEFTIAPTAAVLALTVDALGGIATATVTNGGAGYFKTPTIVVSDVEGGYGAVLKAEVIGGAVVSVYIDDAGAGYTTPTATVIGGNTIEKGMFLMVTKPTVTAGIAIGNCRIVGNNRIAIQFCNPTAAAVTPTAEVYSICALNDVPAFSNLTSYGVVSTGLVSVAANTSAENTAIAVSGILATDIVVGIQQPVFTAGAGVVNARVNAANAMTIAFMNATAGWLTPAVTDIYGVTVYTQAPVPPFRKFTPILSPVSVAADTTVEQTFTVTGLPFINASPATVGVNKPTHQNGLSIAGCRITAANTLGITFQNVTAAIITPTPNEQYTVGCFMAVGSQGGVPGGWVALPFSQSLQHTVDLVNEIQDTMVLEGMINGA